MPATKIIRRSLLALLAGLLVSFLVVGPVLAGEPVASQSLPAGGQDIGVGDASRPGPDGAPPVTTGPAARQGIDVSHWQGGINWHQVALSGIDFAIAKATQGISIVDTRYAQNALRARKQGLRFTAYHFAQPGRGANNAIRQADFFLGRAKLVPTDLVPALDVERAGGLGPAALRRWVFEWLDRVHARLGVKAIIYSNPGFWRSAMGNSSAMARAGYEVLWVAHWNTKRPSVPADHWDGNGWTFWQWTQCGHVPGIFTCVDRDALVGTPLKNLTIHFLRGKVTN